jgi:uncharacterized protein YuzB (UPF0349 family)
MRPIIEFCNSNMALGTENVMKKLEENPDYDVIEYGCLGNCGQCYTTPYAMVNGEIVVADTPDELYIRILATIHTANDALAWIDDMD